MAVDESPEFPARWTPIFARLPEDKRARVLYAAKRAFAERGFAGANVNDIARAAGISVGALYKYFRTKQDIFLAIIERSHEYLEETIGGIIGRERGFRARVRALLEAAVESSRSDPDMVRIYIDCTTEELGPLALGLSRSIESVAATRYRAMVAEAKLAGEVAPGCDEAAAAFCLDDLFLMVQFSFGSEYYKQRLRLFLGEGADEDPASVVEAVSAFIYRALGAAERP
ncbi:MAG TPA: TetR/AcrR family transcriptional regulator [Spirochaetales bacterium]|nr:TetR/AcrR family transcriptional regulator [Spirochaetales bacterium]HRY54454.1 TetR/AcrR family transcriptional regulator [Spirochaetia bacterium]